MNEELKEKMRENRERHWKHILEMFEGGLLTPAEIVNSCLHEFTDSQAPWDEKAMLAFINRLPSVVLDKIHTMLDDLELRGYQWKPFFIGPDLQYVPPPDLPERLRTIHKIIQNARIRM